MSSTEKSPSADLTIRRNLALAECDRLADHFMVRAGRHKRMFKRLQYSSIVSRSR